MWAMGQSDGEEEKEGEVYGLDRAWSITSVYLAISMRQNAESIADMKYYECHIKKGQL